MVTAGAALQATQAQATNATRLRKARNLMESAPRVQADFTKCSAAELMQYRKPVGLGPSGKTWPRWASQRWQATAVRTMPNVVSRISSTFSLATGSQKLGQPVPESNFVAESNNAVSQQMQR